MRTGDLEIRITDQSGLRNVQAFQFDFRRDAHRDEPVEGFQEDPGDAAGPQDEDQGAEELRAELAPATVQATVTESPLAKMPRASTPHSPPTPCTEIAPTGSSIRHLSRTWTDTQASKLAMTLMTTAATGLMHAAPAELATNPASNPLIVMVGSGFCPPIRLLPATKPCEVK